MKSLHCGLLCAPFLYLSPLVVPRFEENLVTVSSAACEELFIYFHKIRLKVTRAFQPRSHSQLLM